MNPIENVVSEPRPSSRLSHGDEVIPRDPSLTEPWQQEDLFNAAAPREDHFQPREERKEQRREQKQPCFSSPGRRKATEGALPTASWRRFKSHSPRPNHGRSTRVSFLPLAEGKKEMSQPLHAYGEERDENYFNPPPKTPVRGVPLARQGQEGFGAFGKRGRAADTGKGRLPSAFSHFEAQIEPRFDSSCCGLRGRRAPQHGHRAVPAGCSLPRLGARIPKIADPSWKITKVTPTHLKTLPDQGLC